MAPFMRVFTAFSTSSVALRLVRGIAARQRHCGLSSWMGGASEIEVVDKSLYQIQVIFGRRKNRCIEYKRCPLPVGESRMSGSSCHGG